MESLEMRARRNDWPDQRRSTEPRGISLWHIIGGIALATVAAVVIVNLPDIKRYVKISTM